MNVSGRRKGRELFGPVFDSGRRCREVSGPVDFFDGKVPLSFLAWSAGP